MTVANEALHEALFAVIPLAVIVLSAFIVCLFRGLRAERSERRCKNGR